MKPVMPIRASTNNIEVAPKTNRSLFTLPWRGRVGARSAPGWGDKPKNLRQRDAVTPSRPPSAVDLPLPGGGIARGTASSHRKAHECAEICACPSACAGTNGMGCAVRTLFNCQTAMRGEPRLWSGAGWPVSFSVPRIEGMRRAEQALNLGVRASRRAARLFPLSRSQRCPAQRRPVVAGGGCSGVRPGVQLALSHTRGCRILPRHHDAS